MATFYVGQRVRIKWSLRWPELAGSAGVVIGHADPEDCAEFGCEYVVSPDCWGSHQCPYADSEAFAPNSDQLEPIQPEGHKTVEWSECLWLPEHLREVA